MSRKRRYVKIKFKAGKEFKGEPHENKMKTITIGPKSDNFVKALQSKTQPKE